MYRTFFIGCLIVCSLNLLGCKLLIKREFNTHCMSSNHTVAQCDCIYNTLEQNYSQHFMKNLRYTSLQDIDPRADFVNTMRRTMQQCQKVSQSNK